MRLTMVGRLSECLLLAYRTPAASVRALVPAGLELLTRGEWAFWNIVVCRVDQMRPAHTPRLAGMSYWHVGYRLYVRTRTDQSGSLSGLFFVRSDADSALISRMGNLFTDFRFHAACVEAMNQGLQRRYRVHTGAGGPNDAQLEIEPQDSWKAAQDSCFHSVNEARSVLKYQPLAFSPDPSGRRVRVAEVHRDESQWREEPIQVVESQWDFLDRIQQGDARLELATRVTPIDYVWRLGRVERLAGGC